MHTQGVFYYQSPTISLVFVSSKGNYYLLNIYQERSILVTFYLDPTVELMSSPHRVSENHND